jgi:hypothetical protein
MSVQTALAADVADILVTLRPGDAGDLMTNALVEMYDRLRREGHAPAAAKGFVVAFGQAVTAELKTRLVATQTLH